MTVAHLSDSTPRAAEFPRAYKRMFALQTEIDAGPIAPRISHLVKLRASQINHCAYCIDMHVDAALEDGLDPKELHLVQAWAEVGIFDEREQAALALTEAMTRLSESHVPRAVWDAAAAVFSEDELGALVWQIIAINAWNRLCVTLRSTPQSLKARSDTAQAVA